MPSPYLHPHLNLVRAFLCVSVAPVHPFVTWGVVCCAITFCFLICLNPWPMSYPRGGVFVPVPSTAASGTQWKKADMFE